LQRNLLFSYLILGSVFSDNVAFWQYASHCGNSFLTGTQKQTTGITRIFVWECPGTLSTVKPKTKFNFLVQLVKFLNTLLTSTLRENGAVLLHNSVHCTVYQYPIVDKSLIRRVIGGFLGPLRPPHYPRPWNRLYSVRTHAQVRRKLCAACESADSTCSCGVLQVQSGGGWTSAVSRPRALGTTRPQSADIVEAAKRATAATELDWLRWRWRHAEGDQRSVSGHRRLRYVRDQSVRSVSTFWRRPLLRYCYVTNPSFWERVVKEVISIVTITAVGTILHQQHHLTFHSSQCPLAFKSVYFTRIVPGKGVKYCDQHICNVCLSVRSRIWQEAQLSQRDRATFYVSKFMLFHEVWQLERFLSAKVTFKIMQGHWHWCHSINHIQFPIY